MAKSKLLPKAIVKFMGGHAVPSKTTELPKGFQVDRTATAPLTAVDVRQMFGKRKQGRGK